MHFLTLLNTHVVFGPVTVNVHIHLWLFYSLLFAAGPAVVLILKYFVKLHEEPT